MWLDRAGCSAFLCNKVVGAITSCTYILHICVCFSIRINWLDYCKNIGQVLAVADKSNFGLTCPADK